MDCRNFGAMERKAHIKNQLDWPGKLHDWLLALVLHSIPVIYDSVFRSPQTTGKRGVRPRLYVQMQ